MGQESAISHPNTSHAQPCLASEIRRDWARGGVATQCRGPNRVILKRQRSKWEGDLEVVKRSVRDESIQVVINLCMETMLGISLHSDPYLN
jgi:hypothetical protein